MAVVQLTHTKPVRIIPVIRLSLLTSIRVDYLSRLKTIEEYSQFHVDLPPDNIYDYITADYAALHNGSYPLRTVLQRAIIPVTRQWLAYWEVLSRLQAVPRVIHAENAVMRDAASHMRTDCVFDGSPGLYFAVGFKAVTVPKKCIIIIELDHISTTAQLDAIALFPATNVRLIHCLADDRLFLTGISTGESMYVPGMEPNMSNIAENSIIEIEKTLIGVISAIYSWRANYYEKLLDKMGVMAASQSARDFDEWLPNFISTSFADESDQWVAATGFPELEK